MNFNNYESCTLFIYICFTSVRLCKIMPLLVPNLLLKERVEYKLTVQTSLPGVKQVWKGSANYKSLQQITPFFVKQICNFIVINRNGGTCCTSKYSVRCGGTCSVTFLNVKQFYKIFCFPKHNQFAKAFSTWSYILLLLLKYLMEKFKYFPSGINHVILKCICVVISTFVPNATF